MNAITATRSMVKLVGQANKPPPDGEDLDHHGKVSTEDNIHGSESQMTANGRRENEGSVRRHPLSFLHAFDDIVSDTNIPQFLLEHKATLRFPETLLLLLVQAERDAMKKGRQQEGACIAWSSNGLSVVIRNKEALVNKLLPEFFCKSKFSSFTRKLYRWGFRQVMGKANSKKKSRADQMVFCHPLFQRDNKPLMISMKSVTAEGTKRAFASQKQQDAVLSEQLIGGDRHASRGAEQVTADRCREQDAVCNPYQRLLEEHMARSLERNHLVSLVTQHQQQQLLPPLPSAHMFATHGSSSSRSSTANVACLLNLSSDQFLMQLMGSRPDGYPELTPLQTLLHATRGVTPDDMAWPIPHQAAYYNRSLNWNLG